MAIECEQGNSGEFILTVGGKFYCTCDNWEEVREAKQEIYNQNVLQMMC